MVQIHQLVQEHEWFLRELIDLIKTGRSSEKLQQNVVPSVSVIDRLVVVILSNNMEHQYKTVIQEGCIEACLDLLENGTYEDNTGLQLDNSGVRFFNRQDAFEQTKQHFTKFETIAMQAISLLFLDERSRHWPLTLSKRICRHCLTYIYQKCYPNSHLSDPYSNLLPNIVVNSLSDLSENVYRRCSNKECNQARVGKKQRPNWDIMRTLDPNGPGLILIMPTLHQRLCRKTDKKHFIICDFLRKCGNGNRLRDKPFTRSDAKTRNCRKRKFGDQIQRRTHI